MVSLDGVQSGKRHSVIDAGTIPSDDHLPDRLFERQFKKMSNLYETKYKKACHNVLIIILLILYNLYLGYAIFHDFSKAKVLLIITASIYLITALNIIITKCCPFLGNVKLSNEKHIKFYYLSAKTSISQILQNKTFHVVVYGCIFLGLGGYLVWDTSNNRSRLMGLAGMTFFILFMYVSSISPSKIQWANVLNGYIIQFLMAIFMLRFPSGAMIVEYVAMRAVDFLSLTYEGTDFMYGFLSSPPAICGLSPVFAFKTIQVLIFFNSVVAILNHFGIISFILKYLSKSVQYVIGTSSTESFNACACVFLGSTESATMIKPYLNKLTLSELHAIAASGMSCIAGSLFAAYISLGACPNYLFAASILSAPGSLSCSKILYPETEKAYLVDMDTNTEEETHGKEGYLLEKISSSAFAAVEWIASIVANLIVFTALLKFLDLSLEYGGNLIGVPNCTFASFLGYVFYPLAFIMGVTDGHLQVLNVSKLMGTKTFLNEFIAYTQLGSMTSSVPSQLTPKSQMIATFALCGFSNIASIGIILATLGSMAPSRKTDLAKVIVRALITGSISCFWTACLAGILIDNPTLCLPREMNQNCFNVTTGQLNHINKELITLMK